MESIETQLNRVIAEKDALLKGTEVIIQQLKDALREERTLHTQVELEERIAKLPIDAKERLRKAFPGTNLGGLRQAINIETKQDRRVERILGK